MLKLGRYQPQKIQSSHLKASPKEDVLCDYELIFMDLRFANNRKITLGASYRPHNNDTKPLEELQRALDNLSTPQLILVGDFNLPDVDWLNIRATNNSTNYELMFDVILASHEGVFRGARFSSLPTNACSAENNIPFPLFYLRGK